MSRASGAWPTAFAILVCAVTSAHGSDRLTVDGYLKTFLVGIDPPGYANYDAAPRRSFMQASNTRGRLNASLAMKDWLSVAAAYDLSIRLQSRDLYRSDVLPQALVRSAYRVDKLNPFLYPDSEADVDNLALFQNLDRLYGVISSDLFDLYVGRQAIAWGSARAVNPTDIIAPFAYNEIDTEDRMGVDAVRLRIPAGSMGEIDAGVVFGEDFEWAESAAYLRTKFYVARTDVAILGAQFRENVVLGLDVTRSMGGAGGWCEAAYVYANGFRQSPADRDESYPSLSTGVDYNFGGLYTFFEYHFNGAGSGTPGEYASRLLSVAYVDASVYLLGRHYAIPGASYQLTALTSAFCEALVNVSDGSALIAPTVEYNVAENFYLSAGAFVGFGDKPEAIPVMGTGADGVFELGMHSEFGSYPDQYFAFARYYY